MLATVRKMETRVAYLEGQHAGGVKNTKEEKSGEKDEKEDDFELFGDDDEDDGNNVSFDLRSSWAN